MSDVQAVPEEDSPPPVEARAEVGRYSRFSAAQERGLVAAALEVPYWVIREGRDFVLYVETGAEEHVKEELAAFEVEAATRRDEQAALAPALPKMDTLPLFIGAWAMSTFWAVQNYLPAVWIDRGDADNREIFAGEWWRTITALTLHGDLAHFIANLAFGLLFAGFLLPRFGSGVTWLGIVLSGAIGNTINAFFYHSVRHSTIGASTAVFGALGMLAFWEFAARWRSPDRRGWWHLVVPLGGGLALLAFLGATDDPQQRVDYMAHFWGFISGMLLAAAILALPLGKWMQPLAGVVALLLPPLAWWLAIRGGR